ncbi:phage prohead protease, HK97 family (plasmid) [Anoxybacillus sp. B7M1]|uniref:HK97 family phage prohead protease n=1 Tax=Anoxybacillus sp. B7M1 TaxID=1490057 RepID=UPI000696F52E|nr:HK97 family phage prohead protease [Anoxybacillus sp. B7M1]ANB66155.1 phage prohead protease, HK97 family [Anoxybacillus sp. B7M1]
MFAIETKSGVLEGLQTKSMQFEIKELNEETNIVEGYASTFGGEPDSYGDIVVKGAFNKTIQESGNRVKYLWQHDWNQPIGKVIELREDEHGLYFKAKISNTPRGQEFLQLAKDGVIDRVSIGYKTIKADYDKESGIRYLREIKLYEISAVTFPANTNAVISSVKNELIDEKAGRMLSEKTKNAIASSIEAMKSAIQSLEDLLAAANGEGTNSDDENLPKSSFTEEEQKEILGLVEEMKNFASAATKGGE